MESKAHLKRISVLYPKAIGDFLFILPALHTLRRALPETHLTLVVKTKQAPLAVPQQGTLVDDVIVLGGQTSWWDVRRKLAESKVDAVVDMAGNDQAGLILAWRGGRRIRPHAADCKGRCALYSPFAETMPRLPVGRHLFAGTDPQQVVEHDLVVGHLHVPAVTMHEEVGGHEDG